jgi:hypothetical protein
MSESEGSGPQRRRESERREAEDDVEVTIRTPRSAAGWMPMVGMLVLGATGGGGLVGVFHPSAGLSQKVDDIDKKLDLLIHDENENTGKVADHERRIQTIELRLAAMGVKP